MVSQGLVTAIQLRARLRSAAEAQILLEGVLQALAHVVPGELCDVMCRCVPEELVWCLRCGPATPDPLIDSELFLGWVMSSLETTGAPDQTLGGDDPLAALIGDEARVRIRVVLEELAARLDRVSASAMLSYIPGGLTESTERFRR